MLRSVSARALHLAIESLQNVNGNDHDLPVVVLLYLRQLRHVFYFDESLHVQARRLFFLIIFFLESHVETQPQNLKCHPAVLTDHGYVFANAFKHLLYVLRLFYAPELKLLQHLGAEVFNRILFPIFHRVIKQKPVSDSAHFRAAVFVTVHVESHLECIHIHIVDFVLFLGRQTLKLLPNVINEIFPLLEPSIVRTGARYHVEHAEGASFLVDQTLRRL